MQNLLAFLLIIIVLPLLLLVSLLILITTFESPLFTQKRIGKNGSPFTIYKMRSMKDGTITIVGRFIRKTGIDELPQLINITKGEMAFVGPRPLTAEDIERLGWNQPEHQIRWTVKPGISGLAQLVNVCDKNVSWHADVTYIQTRSIRTDLSILWRSAMVPILGKSTVKNIIHPS